MFRLKSGVYTNLPSCYFQHEKILHIDLFLGMNYGKHTILIVTQKSTVWVIPKSIFYLRNNYDHIRMREYEIIRRDIC